MYPHFVPVDFLFRNARRIGILMANLAVVAACSLPPFKPDQRAIAPVLDGFGKTTLQPSQIKPVAEALFAQGMTQTYAFNSAEAIRAFKAALAQDPDCAMCAWGVAYQMGPNINDLQRHDLREAVQYVDYAVKHSSGASVRDRALIDSLALRYGHASVARDIAPLQGEICGPGTGGDRADPLDIAYAERMLHLANRFADDPDVQSIYAEAEMIATRGDYWDRRTGKPAGRIGEVASRLEASLIQHPDHIGLNHYLIHSVDAVQVASRGLASAERLGQLAPKSPHLLHMPGHIFAQVGRYADATRVNQLAVAADEAMDLELAKQGFSATKDWRVHSRHFQWYAALMEGRSDLALATARAAAEQATGDNEYAEYMRSLPMLTLLQFQNWDALLTEPMPGGNQGMAIALGEMARGLALVHAGQTVRAKAALMRLESAGEVLLKKHVGAGTIDKLVRSLVNSSLLQLDAALAFAEQRGDEAMTKQNLAVEAAVDANLAEPPMLASGPRLRLGAMQLHARQWAAAETTFKTELVQHPGSGWALLGLGEALKAQGKRVEMLAVQSQLARNWTAADVQLRELH